MSLGEHFNLPLNQELAAMQMDTLMNRDDALKLLETEAGKLDKPYFRQSDLILQLAQLIADTRGVLSDENFASLVRIGALIYKSSVSREQARAEIAATMQELTQNGKMS